MATPTYHARMTTAGAVAEAVAHMNGATLRFTHMAVGDGQYPVPDPNRTSLVSEKWRGPVNRVFINPKRADQLLIELVVPNEVGGFFIRELGLFNSDGILCAIAKVAENYKPLPSEGQSRHSIVRMVIKMAHAEVVEIKIDGSGGFVPLDVYNAHVGSRGEAHGVATEAVPGFMSAQDKTAHNALRAAKPINQVFAGPAGGGAGAPAFRALVAADIPGLDFSKIISGKPNTRDGWGIVDVPLSNGSGASGTWGINISGTARRLAAQDTRDQADLPQNKLGWALSLDFKTNASAGNPAITASGMYSHIVTVAGYDTDGGSGGWPSQLSFGDGLAVRQATGAATWGPWRTVVTSANVNSYAPGLSGSGAVGTWGIGITGSAGAVGGQPLSQLVRSEVYTNTDLNALTDSSRVTSVYPTANAPFGNGFYYNLINVRHRGGISDGNQYGGQIAWGMNGSYGRIAFRSQNGATGVGTWDAWKELLHDGNVSAFAPALNGAGAYGTWGISVAGSAAALGGITAASTMQYRGFSEIDVAVGNGFFNVPVPGASDNVLAFNAGGSTGQVQLRFSYQGGFSFRNKTDDTWWNPWQAVLTDANYGNYTVPKAGGVFSGNVGIHAPVAVLSVRDTDTAGANIAAYVSLQDSGGVERGWMGYGTNNGVLTIRNAVGDVAIMAASGSIRGDAPAGFITGGWFRSEAATGWFNATYGGGIYMSDPDYVRVYNGKGFAVDAGIDVGAGRAEGQVRINYAGQSNQTYLYRNSSLALGGHNTALGNLFTISNSRDWNLPATLNVAGAVNAATPHAAADDSQLATTAWVNAKGFSKLSEFAVNLSASGWQRLPSGLILQWGRVTEATYDADYRYFPLAFPSACVGVLFSLDDATTQGFSGNNGTVVKIVDRTKFLWDAGGTWAGGGVGYFFAIGW